MKKVRESLELLVTRLRLNPNISYFKEKSRGKQQRGGSDSEKGTSTGKTSKALEKRGFAHVQVSVGKQNFGNKCNVSKKQEF